MSGPERVESYWRAFLRSRPDLDPALYYYEAFSFGNRPESAGELAGLVLRGVKTATSSLFWHYELRGKEPMREGDYHIVEVPGDGPVCVIRTTELRMRAFDEVDAGFAYDYGEGDRTLEWWREHMWSYYAEECRKLGLEAKPSMPLICERFEVVFRGSGAGS